MHARGADSVKQALSHFFLAKCLAMFLELLSLQRQLAIELSRGLHFGWNLCSA